MTATFHLEHWGAVFPEMGHDRNGNAEIVFAPQQRNVVIRRIIRE
jgi:hypothetical protein